MSAYIKPKQTGARCNKWQLCVAVGSREKRVTKTRIFEGTKREAQAELRKFQAEVEGMDLAGANFKEFATRWNDSRLASEAIRPNTHTKYKWYISVVSPLLPESISNITAADIVDAYATLHNRPEGEGRGWSGTSLRSLHNSLSAVFDAAVANKLIAATPMQGVSAPKIDTKERRALDTTKTDELLLKLKAKDAHQFAISLMLRLGLRPGECCQLEWQDVQENVLVVRRAVTKTNAGARSLPLDLDAQLLIKQRRAIVEKSLRKVGAKLEPTDKLCCELDGRPLEYDVLRRWWQRNRGKKPYNLPGWTLHELRHSYLTNLAQAGVHPSLMQKLAGHESVETVMKIYTHVNDADLREAQEQLARARKLARKRNKAS